MVDPQPLSDPRVLRAIAHPVRNRVLDELQASGPARAADIARELGIPANQASFHLRQLAKYGLVEEAPEEARDKRDRVWRASATGGYRVELSKLAEEPGGRAAVEVFRSSKLAWLHQVVDRSFAMSRKEGSRCLRHLRPRAQAHRRRGRPAAPGDRRPRRLVGRPHAGSRPGAPDLPARADGAALPRRADRAPTEPAG